MAEANMADTMGGGSPLSDAGVVERLGSAAAVAAGPAMVVAVAWNDDGAAVPQEAAVDAGMSLYVAVTGMVTERWAGSGPGTVVGGGVGVDG